MYCEGITTRKHLRELIGIIAICISTGIKEINVIKPAGIIKVLVYSPVSRALYIIWLRTSPFFSVSKLDGLSDSSSSS